MNKKHLISLLFTVVVIISLTFIGQLAQDQVPTPPLLINEVSIRTTPINIIIPAYNEESRISPTLATYCDYFNQFNLHITVVLNGVTDNTRAVVEKQQRLYPDRITIIESAKGKGSAIKAGFLDALKGNYSFIGFVDADGATAPDQYHTLLEQLWCQSKEHDGVIASRYMKGSDIGAPRPVLKEYGRKFLYNRRIEKKLKLYYHDYQCGAKLFTRKTIEKIAPLLTESRWAIDLDILYLCQHFNFHIKEIPIIWRDKEGSHLSILSSIKDFYQAVNRIKAKARTLTSSCSQKS